MTGLVPGAPFVTTTSWVLLAAAVVVAAANWWSRATDDRRLEYLTKPTVTALLALAALTLQPESEAMRAWFVAGLVLCLAGDVLLMLPKERFVAGLAAFLLAHVAFTVGFLVPGDLAPLAAGLGVLVVLAGAVTVGRGIVAGAARTSPALRLPVLAYLAAISAMVLVAFAHAGTWGVVGALAFYASDALLGSNRFVQPFPNAPVAIMVTYHVALVALVLSLV